MQRGDGWVFRIAEGRGKGVQRDADIPSGLLKVCPDCNGLGMRAEIDPALGF